MSVAPEVTKHVVLAHMAESRRSQAHLPSLWQKATKLGWFAQVGSKVVIQVGQEYRSSLVMNTARSLADELHKCFPDAEIQVIDPVARPDEWKGFSIVDDTRDPLAIAAVATRRPLRVPRLWLQSYFLITVASPGPPLHRGIAGMLDAQAEPLRRVNDGAHLPENLLVEAHRLAASDLCVLCGHTLRDRSESPLWWITSPSDVAIEQTLSTLILGSGNNMPGIRAISRHEILPSPPTLRGHLDKPQGYTANALAVLLYWSISRTVATFHSVLHDARVVKGNLYRIAPFVHRRLARISRKQEAP